MINHIIYYVQQPLGGHTLSMTAIVLAFFNPIPHVSAKMSLLLSSMTSLLLMLNANCLAPLPLGCGRT